MATSRNEMNHAASMVAAIAAGKWTDEPPSWAEMDGPSDIPNYDRACLTAEAFIIFFQAFNPAFDQQRFLVACGLVEPTAKRRKA
jgi:hypothetical protein